MATTAGVGFEVRGLDFIVMLQNEQWNVEASRGGGVSPEPLQPPMWMNLIQMLLMEGETGAPREKPHRGWTKSPQELAVAGTWN